MRIFMGFGISSRFLLLALVLFSSGCGLFRTDSAVSSTPLEQIRKQIRLQGAAPLKAGAARVEITPPVGTPLAGYAKRRGKPSVGIRDPLFVRALALTDGEDTAILVSADLLVFPHPLAEEIVARISSETKVLRQGIVLAATHTHSGAGSIARGFLHEQVFGPYRKEIVEGLTARILWAARQALENQKQVRWSSVVLPDLLRGKVENRADPGGPADPSLTVFALESTENLQNKPLAILIHAAAHPTLLDSKQMQMSADFPGELAREIEATYPGSVCLFFNGAAGDARPADALGDSPEERLKRFARIFSEAVSGSLSRGIPRAEGELAAWGGWFELPPPQMRLGRLPLHPAIGRLMRPGSTFLHLVALDRLLFAPLPAELNAELGLELKRKLIQQGLEPVLIGYADGYLGYAVTADQYRSGSYEASMTWYGPDFGASLIDGIGRFADLYSQGQDH